MKKIISLSLIQILALPVFAVCSITGGACSSNFERTPLQQQLVPDHLQNMQRTDAFQREIVQPYGSNTTNIDHLERPKPSGYDASCQFGVCLPGNTNTDINPTFENN
jgi:hypothetical protein